MRRHPSNLLALFLFVIYTFATEILVRRPHVHDIYIQSEHYNGVIAKVDIRILEHAPWRFLLPHTYTRTVQPK